ncbi:MAG: AtpZ/AtpI family protein [Albidovulum sp.]|nr:AtpZ/AtpI family protein [Albidovulum sp.]
MSEPADKESAASIRGRIEAAKSARRPGQPDTGPASQAHVAWRMVFDLVAGIGVGAACGFGLDSLFGTTPVLLVVMTLLGFAAGVNLMLRTAKTVGAEGGAKTDLEGSSGKAQPKEKK